MRAIVSQSIALACAVALGACASGPRSQRGVKGQNPPSDQSKNTEGSYRHYRPQRASAMRYGERRVDQVEELSELDVWRRHFAHHGYAVEAGLSHVAKDALLILRDQGALAASVRDDLMAWHGQTSIDVSFSRVSGHLEPHQAHSYVDKMVEKDLLSANEAARLGLALIRQAERVDLVVVQARPRVEVTAFPRKLSLGQSLVLEGQLLSGRTKPVMMVLDPQGQGRTVLLQEDKGRAFGRLACDRGPGRYQVEWIAQGNLGPEVVLNVPVYCAVSPPRVLRYRKVGSESFTSVQDVERQSWALVNQVRQSQGLAPLDWDSSLAQLARLHSRDMERLDYVGHRSPQQGSFDARLRGAGIQAPLVLENVASGVGPQEILDRLMASPGHRFNILNPEVTHLGVGVAIRTTLGPHGQDSLFLTQHFARWAESERKEDRLRTPISLVTPR